MHKRGQVTIFVILGILIVMILALVFYLYGNKLKIETNKQPTFDASQVEPLKNYIEDCINIKGQDALNLVGKQGGLINPVQYQNWNCKAPNDCDHVSYLCYTTEYAACYNKRPFLAQTTEEEINSYLTKELPQCINLQKIRDVGFNIQTGTLKVSTSIGDQATIINLDYPITITKGDTLLKEDRFSKTFNVPLGKLLSASHDIVQQSIDNSQGVVYYEGDLIRQYGGNLEVNRHTYQKTQIYVTKFRNNPYIFQFAIQNYVVPFP